MRLRFSWKRALLLVFSIGLCSLPGYLLSKQRPLFESATAEMVGGFTAEGHYKTESLNGFDRLRKWGSWSGSDENQGQLRFGPIVLPQFLNVLVAGNAAHLGTEFYIQDTRSGDRMPISAGDAGLTWRKVSLRPPPDWIGREVVIVAVDRAAGAGGWLAISEPFSDYFGGDAPILFIKAIGAALLIAALLGGWVFVFVSLLETRGWATSRFSVLLAFSMLAALSYLLCIIYYFAPALGRVLSASFLSAGGVLFVREVKLEERVSREAKTVLATVAVIFGFYLTVLLLYEWSGDLYTLMANRFSPYLPSDNIFPHIAAERLYNASSINELIGDWHMSDRPPLQWGWLLLTYPLASILGHDQTTVSAITAMYFQICWVVAIYPLFRAISLSPAQSIQCILALSLSGFFIQNTVFTWPKFPAAAFCAGAFLILISGNRTNREAAIASLFIALAWLSHGGAAFSVLALIPWVVVFLIRSRNPGRKTLLLVLPFFMLVCPWLAYQKLVDPPGDRLIKWHLGGQIAPDSRSALSAIKDAYSTTSTSELINTRISNLKLQVSGDWRSLFSSSSELGKVRRNEEFFFTARTLAWWLLGIGALAFIWMRPRRFSDTCPSISVDIQLLAWTALTYLAWIVLMFLPQQALIHQGSYMALMGAFVLLASCLLRASTRFVLFVFLLQGFTFFTTYYPPNEVVRGTVIHPAILLSCVAFVSYLIPLKMSAGVPSEVGLPVVGGKVGV